MMNLFFETGLLVLLFAVSTGQGPASNYRLLKDFYGGNLSGSREAHILVSVDAVMPTNEDFVELVCAIAKDTNLDSLEPTSMVMGFYVAPAGGLPRNSNLDSIGRDGRDSWLITYSWYTRIPSFVIISDRLASTWRVQPGPREFNHRSSCN